MFFHPGNEIVAVGMMRKNELELIVQPHMGLSLEIYEKAATKALGKNARRSCKNAVSERIEYKTSFTAVTIIHIIT